MTKLGNISNIISGYYFRASMTSFSDGEIRLIQPSDLDDYNVDKLTTIDAPSTRLKKGDILLSNRGKLRAMVMPVDGDFVFPASIYAIRLISKNYAPEFVMAYLNSDSGQAQLSFLSSGSHISNLTKVALGDFELPIVSLECQTRITEIDSDLIKYRAATTKKADLIEAVKNNLIKELK